MGNGEEEARFRSPPRREKLIISFIVCAGASQYWPISFLVFLGS